MQLPLFQGVSAQQISTLVEKIPFHFIKYRNGENIVATGDNCSHMRFVVSGKVRTETRFHHLHVRISQTIAAPNVIAPDYLFGLDNSYPFTAIASGECGLLQLRKSDYVAMLQSDKVFLFNILNYLSRNNQRFNTSLLNMKNGSAHERLAQLLTQLTLQSSAEVTVHFMQKDLCSLLGTQRSTLMRTLSLLQEQGLITYSATQINVIDLQSIRKQ